ncbi:MAG: N-acetylmuramoyl-L-alanine amidase [Desulforhopalus sp.]|nr:N-acetylmuramoyl-L-alanine amidase [Desulforhopalus sp.]
MTTPPAAKPALLWILATSLSLLVSCAPAPYITNHQARSQESRVQAVVLHFTREDFSSSLKTLTEGEVSSHYLVRDEPVEIYQLVDESQRAYHAGISSWRGRTFLNASSIGIEIVNAGDYVGVDGVAYHDYPGPQVDAVIALLKDIVARHTIRPEFILGHSDIAPHRKTDPGPKFPWTRLADAGLIPWPDRAVVAARQEVYQDSLPDLLWFQNKLIEHGFTLTPTGELDKKTREVLAALQMKYRPERYDGQADAETAALLDVLTSSQANKEM